MRGGYPLMKALDIARYYGHAPGPWEPKARGIAADYDIYDAAGELVAGDVIGQGNAMLLSDAAELLTRVQELEKQLAALRAADLAMLARVQDLETKISGADDGRLVMIVDRRRAAESALFAGSVPQRRRTDIVA